MNSQKALIAQELIPSGSCHFVGSRPSKYGEKFLYERDEEDVHGRPMVPPNICPECHKNFGTNSDALGNHIMNVHYPRPIHSAVKVPVKCPKGCGRWLETADRNSRTEARSHKKFCNGKPR